ncbi:MAG: tetratricopeptide repeat protein [Bacteroidales bacterium]
MRLIKVFILLLAALRVSGQEYSPDIDKALQNRDYPLVVKMCDELLLKQEQGKDILKIKGSALMGMQDYENALASFRLAAEKDTSDLSLDYYSSECLEQLGDLQGAIMILENRYLTDSLDLYSLQNLARIYIKGRNFEKAFPYCMNLSERFPDNYTFSKNLATSAYQLGYFDIAFTGFNEAWKLNRRDLTLPVSLANCYMKMKEPEKAIDILNEGLSYDSLNINILKTAGYLYFLGEDYNSAARYFKKALSQGDSTEFVRKNLGISLLTRTGSRNLSLS